MQTVRSSISEKDGPLCFVSGSAPQLTESEMVMSFDRVVLLHSEIALFRYALREFNCNGTTRPTLLAAHMDDEDGPVEAEAAGVFSAPTHSDVGFPEYNLF